MFNSHIHTEYSHDCKIPMEDMCLAAIDAGFSGIAITDHCNADFCISDNSYRSILASAADARKFNDKYKDKLTVTAGVEMSDILRKPDYTARLIKAIRPDSIIASVHNVIVNNMPQHISRMDFGKMTDSEAYKIIGIYFDDLIKVSEKADFDILAHLTLPLRYTNGVYGKQLVLDSFSAKIEKILLALIKREKALEINTSDVNHQLYDFMPGKDIVKKYFGLGGRLVTIGTDAHKPCNISAGFDEAKTMLKEIGFDNYGFYKNRKPVKISF